MNKKIIFVAIILIIAGVSSWIYMKNSSSISKYSGPIQDINLQLKWKHQAQFAGHYVAIEKGFYEDLGMKVNPIPFDFKESVVDAVVSGKADFATGSADEIIFARAKGIPIKAIAIIYRINPTVAFSLKKSGITKPQDFVGKKVGIEKSANIQYLYSAMMSKLNIDRTKITEIPVGYDAKELLEGKVDVSTGYITNEPNLVKEAGQDVNTILMADYGVDMYADVLFTTEKMINTNPDLVARFVQATIKGWQYALENEEEAVDMTLKYATNSNIIHELSMLHNSAPLIHTGTAPLGYMDQSGWEKAQNILVEQKLLTKPINITDVYTVQFLDLIYKK